MRKISWTLDRIRKRMGWRETNVHSHFGSIADELFMSRGGGKEMRGWETRLFLSSPRNLSRPQIFSRVQLPRAILSRCLSHLNAPRENAETHEIAGSWKAFIKGSDSSLQITAQNCGEIRYVGSLRCFRDRYMLTFTYESFLFFIITALSSFFPLLLSNPREITRLRNYIATALNARKDLLHNPLLKSSYCIVIFGNRYVIHV